MDFLIELFLTRKLQGRYREMNQRDPLLQRPGLFGAMRLAMILAVLLFAVVQYGRTAGWFDGLM